MKCFVKRSWVELEKEHTQNKALAKKIACDHVKEFGKGYYPALIKMERRLRK